MKRVLLVLTIVGFLLPLAPPAQADTEVSLNFFYDNLSPYGNWIEVGDYGYCFQPNVAVSSSDWRPYADGYWAYTDVGWTWVSYEDFGWATYHYGRWSNLADYGWVWVPGYEWGPAWVSWRTGGDYVGWAPLPPVDERIYEGGVIGGQVDVLFNIGPLYYNFCDVRYIGEPVLRARIFAPSRNVTIISQTVNVTNITYNNSIVYNHGPDYNRLNQYSTRPIQQLKLQRETNFPVQGGPRANLNRVSGNQLMVTAPTIQRSHQANPPKQVKAKVDKPKVEHGWQGIADRQQIEARMKKENPKNVPPPNFQPQKVRRAAPAGIDPNAGNAGNGGNGGNAGNAGKAGQVQKDNQTFGNPPRIPNPAPIATKPTNLVDETKTPTLASPGPLGKPYPSNKINKGAIPQTTNAIQQAGTGRPQHATPPMRSQQVTPPVRAQQAQQFHPPPPPPPNQNPNATPKGKKKSGDEQPPPPQ